LCGIQTGFQSVPDPENNLIPYALGAKVGVLKIYPWNRHFRSAFFVLFLDISRKEKKSN